MTDSRGAYTTRTAPPKPVGSRMKRIAYAVGAVTILIFAGGQFASRWFVPACDKPAITSAVRDIFGSQNFVLTVFDDIRELSDVEGRRMCSAHIETAQEAGTVQYSIVWQWWSPYVTIEKVEAGPHGSGGTTSEGTSGSGGGNTPSGETPSGTMGDVPKISIGNDTRKTGGDTPASAQ